MKNLFACVVLFLAGCASERQRIAGYYVSTKGGLNETVFLELKKNGTYELNHLFVSDVLRGNVFDSYVGTDRGHWLLEAGELKLAVQEKGTDSSPMMLPAYCDRFTVATDGKSFLLTSVSVPAIPVASPERIVLKSSVGPPWLKNATSKKPNQSVQPMPGPVTPRAPE
jgi:hypothetical protein